MECLILNCNQAKVMIIRSVLRIYLILQTHLLFAYENQRTNGPINAHFISVMYTNNLFCLFLVIYMYILPRQGQMN